MSLATASRVLNGSTRKVAESYRERVETAAGKLGYTPNLSAQATARGTSAMVALLVADIADPAGALLASGVARGAEEAGVVLTIAVTEHDPEREEKLVRALRGHRPRGLILAEARTRAPQGAELDQELQTFAGMGGRAVTVGGDGQAARNIALDDREGARALGAELAGMGYREAVVVAAPEGLRASDARAEGFAEGFEGGAGVVRDVRRTGFARDDGYAAARQLLSDGLSAGTLVFAVSDALAIGVMAAVRDAGREVGADIAVAGFDDVPAARDLRPGLTTVRVPLEELGYQALRAVVETDPDVSTPKLTLDVLVRESTPPRR